MIRPSLWIAATIVIAIAQPARADNTNEIRAVTYSEDGATTKIHVRGAQTPTFTVYKLERPSRVVVDVPRARLAETLRGHEGATVYTASTWAVSTIAAQQLDDGGQVVRVIVTLARAGRYDVKTSGNEVVVMVTARDPSPPKGDAEAIKAEQAKREAAEKSNAAAQADAAKARDAALAAQAEAVRLRKTAAEHAARADAAEKATKQANANDLARVKAEAERAKQDAAKANAAAIAAQGEAERMRVAAELAKQEALADAAKAKQQANAARVDADRARQQAAREAESAKRTRDEAEAMKLQAQRDAESAKRATEAANKAAADAKAAAERDARLAKAAAAKEAAAAKQDLARVKGDAEAAKQDLARVKAEAETARRDAERARAEAARTKQEADALQRQAEEAKREAEAAQRLAKDSAARTKAEVDAARREAEAAQRLAKDSAARTKAEADAARRDAEAAQRLAKDSAARTKAEVDAARRDAEAAQRLAKDSAARTKAEVDAARRDAEAARRDAEAAQRDAKDSAARTKAEADAAIARAKADAEAAVANAKAEAQRARAEADTARADAETVKRTADRTRVEADKVLGEAKQKIAALDKRMASAQALEDKARAANAAAEAREQVAREQVAAAKKEREQAEAAAKLAVQRAADATKGDRDRLAADAKVAEERVAKARRAAEEADARRAAAEAAANRAKHDLDSTRTTLAGVEKQRSDAESAASDAARKRGEAEAAASDATRRRAEAEAAVADAGRKRKDAEQAAAAAAHKRTEAEQQRVLAEAQRKAAEDAARDAKAAADAADRQRVVAEKSAREANAAKASAEKSLDELTTRRLAAEHAAAELEARTKAEAKAQAQVAAAQARKAGDAEVARARTEATRLADERKRAETELADRRKAVAAQQAETTRLEQLATAARDAATREESRRGKLAQQRIAEEKELARLRAERDAAKKVAVKPIDVKPVDHKPPVDTKPVKLAKVNDVVFKGSSGTGQVEIAFTGDAKVTVGEVTKSHVELIIDNAELAGKLERKLDVSRYGSPVRAVSSFRDRRAPNRIRMIAELSETATPRIDRVATGVKWVFVGTNEDLAKRAPTTRTQHVPPPVVGGFGATSTPLTQQSVTQVPGAGNRRRVYRGATVDFEFKDAPIHELLRLIADTGRINIVVPDNVNARVTVRLKRVPWDQALEVILASHGLWYRREGNLYRVADRKELDKEDAEAAARRELELKSERPRPEIVRLNYADAKELAPKLQGMVSPSGTLQVDERQNALIINDIGGNRNEIARLARALDTQTPQISISARIVEARSTFLRQIGIQWGGRATASAQGGNATGLLFPSSVSLVGGNEDQQTIRQGVAAPSDFAVNLPAATGSGEGGAIGLSLGSIGANFALNLRLSALEDTGTIRIISEPKITVLNNKPASMLQGVSIPIQVISAQGTQTQLIQADLKLEVTPYVSASDCTVQMKIIVTKNEPDFVNVGARGDPSFLRKEASTTMLVSDRDTAVLGGIYTRNSGLAYKKIPFFGDLPVLGWFFKNRRENDDRTELLIFITPTITNKGALACQ